MSKQIQNEFSWSFSRHERFERCQREYYIYSYGSWGGWLGSAPEDVQLAYRLKKMSNVPMYKGTVVHDAIADAVRTFRATEIMPKFAKIAGLIQERVEREFELSAKNHGWVPSPSRDLALIEHYSDRHARWLRSDTQDRIWVEAIQMVKNFYDSALFDKILAAGPDSILGIEELEQLKVDRVPVWLVIDMYYQPNEESISVIDYKSGKRSKGHSKQLAVYRLHLERKFRKIKRFKLVNMYLKEGPDAYEVHQLEAGDWDSTAAILLLSGRR